MKDSSSKVQAGAKPEKSVSRINLLNSEEFGTVGVLTDLKEAEGYFLLDGLCRILDLQKQEVQSQLDDHLFVVEVDVINEKQHELHFVDEVGLYLMFLMSKSEDAIRFQEWLNEAYLRDLYEQRKVLHGHGKDVLLIVEDNRTRQALRYMATAHNVVKSGQFRVGKDIPEVTMTRLMGWWNNPSDQSTFMLQFNCQGGCYCYQYIRMNIYLTKQEEGDTDACEMRISFLDLEDDNYEIRSYKTWLPYCAVSDNMILDYILEELTIDGDYLEPEKVDLMAILNSIVSFGRSRRV